MKSVTGKTINYEEDSEDNDEGYYYYSNPIHRFVTDKRISNVSEKPIMQ